MYVRIVEKLFGRDHKIKEGNTSFVVVIANISGVQGEQTLQRKKGYTKPALYVGRNFMYILQKLRKKLALENVG